MDESRSPQLTYSDIRVAADCIAGSVRPVTVTALDPGTILTGEPGPCHVWLVLEFMQFTGSFKARGAQNFLATHRADETLPDAGVTIASAGNAGLACAWAAKTQGVRATVFVPASTPTATLNRLRSFKADVRLASDAHAACRSYAEETGALHSNIQNDPLLAAGAGTLFDEIHRQIPDLDTVVVAVGGGGLLAGTASAAANHGIRTVAVEPEHCRALNAAIEANRVVDVEIDSVAADSLGARCVSGMALYAAQHYDVHSVLVTDADIIFARRALWRRWRLLVEHGAAAALAALTAGGYQPRPRETIAVVLGGANTSPVDL